MVDNYRIKALDVHHETIAGETVIVNLASGKYYSLRGVGASIWTLFETGANQAQVIANIAHNYDKEPDAVKGEIEEFISRLKDEELIEPSGDVNQNRNPEYKPGSEAQAYQTPNIEVFSDMQELLLIDPVHEVDHSGWPNAKPDSE